MKCRYWKGVQLISQSKDIIGDLSEQILKGHLLPNDPMPSQRSLAKQFDVSRGAVREAFSHLEESGYIATAQGKVSRVANLLSLHMPEETPADTSLEYQRQVMEARAELEAKAAYYAALRASEDDLKLITAEFEAMEARVAENTLARAKADLSFHRVIARASHNLLVVSFSEIFYTRYFNVIYAVLSKTLKKYGRYPDGLMAQHREIYRAILNRDAERAKVVAREHILSTLSLLD